MEQIANPSVFKTIPVQTGGTKNPIGWNKKNKIILIIGILVIVILVMAFFSSRFLFFSDSKKSLNFLAPRVNALTEARLSLVPNAHSYKAGDPVIIEVKLFTGGQTTDSTDLVVKYDPAFLAPEDQNFATAGNAYSEYPAFQIDKTKGLIGISGITSPGKKTFNGAGTFATLNFRALKDGETAVIIDFEKDATADSNVVLTGSATDALGIVDNAKILISGSINDTPKTSDKSCPTFKQSCMDANKKSGIQLCTGGSTKLGSCGYDPEFTTSCEMCQVN